MSSQQYYCKHYPAEQLSPKQVIAMWVHNQLKKELTPLSASLLFRYNTHKCHISHLILTRQPSHVTTKPPWQAHVAKGHQEAVPLCHHWCTHACSVATLGHIDYPVQGEHNFLVERMRVFKWVASNHPRPKQAGKNRVRKPKVKQHLLSPLEL